MFDWLFPKKKVSKEGPKPSLFSKPAAPMWRQGDVFIIQTKALPKGEHQVVKPVLAEGEVTGHAHRVERAADARVLSTGSGRYLEVLANETTIVHEEHGPITLPKGIYEIRIQREYSPQEIRRVVD